MHTPGPWEVYSLVEIRAANKYVVAVLGNPIHMHNDITKANARLIAAAPDMLKALQELHEAVGRFGWVKSDPKPSECARRVSIMNRARAAIAAATGGDNG